MLPSPNKKCENATKIQVLMSQYCVSQTWLVNSHPEALPHGAMVERGLFHLYEDLILNPLLLQRLVPESLGLLSHKLTDMEFLPRVSQGLHLKKIVWTLKC